jgi:hypothetical protein
MLEEILKIVAAAAILDLAKMILTMEMTGIHYYCEVKASYASSRVQLLLLRIHPMGRLFPENGMELSLQQKAIQLEVLSPYEPLSTLRLECLHYCYVWLLIAKIRTNKDMAMLGSNVFSKCPLEVPPVEAFC